MTLSGNLVLHFSTTDSEYENLVQRSRARPRSTVRVTIVRKGKNIAEGEGQESHEAEFVSVRIAEATESTTEGAVVSGLGSDSGGGPSRPDSSGTRGSRSKYALYCCVICQRMRLGSLLIIYDGNRAQLLTLVY